MRGRPAAGALASKDGGGRGTQEPKPSASHHIGVAAIDILVVRRSTRHPWRYDPDMAAMLGHAKGSKDQEQN